MKTPVIALLWFLIIAAAFLADFNRAGFFIESFVIGKEAEVYAVCGDERVKLSDEDAEKVVYLLCHKYDARGGFKCPYDDRIGFDIEGKRYAIALDGCSTVQVYNAGGEHIGDGYLYLDDGSIDPYYFKYFDNEDIGECLSSDN